MGLVERQTLLANLTPPFEGTLAAALIDEYISVERRYVQRDWEPAELDGGQFSEILARIIYHLDSGTLSLSKGFDDCVKYIENEQVTHHIQPRQQTLHLSRVLRTIYKFRSQRGAVHISPSYSPNQMDAKLIAECVRWAFAETLRVFWNGDRDLVAKSIRELLQFDVPCIGSFEGALLVQRVDLSTEEELLVLLHYAGEGGFSRRDLGVHAKRAPSSITGCLQRLCDPGIRQVVVLPSGQYRLTDLGAKRVREELASKLMIS